MRYKTLAILFAFLVFNSCKNEKTFKIQLPTAGYTNIESNEIHETPIFKVSQINNTKYEIVFKDTLFLEIDTTTHSKIYNLKIRNSGYHDYFHTALIELDKNISYSEFNKVLKEFRKVNIQRFIFTLQNNSYLSFGLFPYFPSESDYIEDRLRGYSPPRTSVEFDHYNKLLEEKKYVKFEIEDGIVKIIDHNGDEVLNYKEFALANKKYFIIYHINDEQTYEDFITVFSKIRQYQDEILEIINTKTESIKENNEYRFIIIEKNELKALLDSETI